MDVTAVAAITYPGGTNQVAYTYDAANRLATVTDWNTNQTSYAYDDADRMTTTTLPNGVVGTSTYDAANRLTGISWAKGGTTLASASYTLDNVGNRTSRTDLAGTQSYGYDNAYRLTSVTYPGPATTTYSYDAFGNRTSLADSSGTTTTAYNDAGEITSVTPPSPASPVSYTYDANGNLTNRGSDTFGWDYENRLTSATVGGTSTTFTYRGDGLRVSQTTGGTTTSYTWDLNGSLPVVLDDGAQYVYGNGLVSQVSGANTYYYLADGLGSVMATTDASGNLVNGYTYDVYGKTSSSTGSQPNSFQFAGQQTDATGLQYLRARYYDPSTGTFLSRDPLVSLPEWAAQPYGYAQCNATTLFDADGLRPTDGSDDRNVSRAEAKCNSIANNLFDAVERIKGAKLVLDGLGTGRPQNKTGRDSLQGKVRQYKDAVKSLRDALSQWDKYNCSEVIGNGSKPDEAESLLKEYDGGKAKEYEKLYKSSHLGWGEFIHIPFTVE